MRISSEAGRTLRHRRRLVAVAAVVAGLATGTGCGTPTEDIAGTADIAGAADPVVDTVDDATRTHVEFEAAWHCDLTRFAFDDLAAIDDMRSRRLDAHGISARDHDDFLTRLDAEPVLAELVAELSASCTGADGDRDGPVEL